MSHSTRFPQTIYTLPYDNNRLALGAVPKLEDPLQERLDRKQKLAAAYRLFGRLGYEVGVAGHFTARDPIHPEQYWINPLGVPFSQITVSHLLRVDSHGQVVEGEGLLNTSALELHHDLQQARPDVVGIAHLHGFHGRVWSSLGRLFDPITAESGAFLDDQVIFPRHALRTASGALEQDRTIVAQAFVETFAQNNLLVWQNHGLWVTGQTVESAAWRFILAEDTARVHLLAHSAGAPLIPAPDALEGGVDKSRHEFFAWLNFLPLWDQIRTEEPDLFN